MKIRTYIRVARNGYKAKVDAATSENQTPLYTAGYGGSKNFLPTVAFAIDLVIPDELFSSASRVIAEINVATKEAKVLGEMLVPEINKIIRKVNKPKK